MSGHATLAPSAASRWMKCPGSVRMEQQYVKLEGPPKQNPAAALGTALHEIAELALIDNEDPLSYLGGTFNNITINDPDLITERVTPYVDYIRVQQKGFTGGDLLIESRVTVVENLCWGTADAVIASDDVVIVTDLKTGTGVKVFAEDNHQLMIYALGVYLDLKMLYDFTPETKFKIVVSQGALDHHDEWDITVKKLLAFKKKVEAAVIATQDEKASLVPGEDQCRWCLGRSVCPALAGLVASETAKDLDDMSAADLARALQDVKLIKAWISGVEDRAKERLLNGKKVPGYKVVQGRRTRRWKDPEYAMKYLAQRVRKFKATFVTEKFATPAQAEKLLRKAEVFKPVDLDAIMEWQNGQPTIAPESDSREALEHGDRARSDFADVVN